MGGLVGALGLRGEEEAPLRGAARPRGAGRGRSPVTVELERLCGGRTPRAAAARWGYRSRPSPSSAEQSSELTSPGVLAGSKLLKTKLHHLLTSHRSMSGSGRESCRSLRKALTGVWQRHAHLGQLRESLRESLRFAALRSNSRGAICEPRNWSWWNLQQWDLGSVLNKQSQQRQQSSGDWSNSHLFLLNADRDRCIRRRCGCFALRLRLQQSTCKHMQTCPQLQLQT